MGRPSRSCSSSMRRAMRCSRSSCAATTSASCWPIRCAFRRAALPARRLNALIRLGCEPCVGSSLTLDPTYEAARAGRVIPARVPPRTSIRASPSMSAPGPIGSRADTRALRRGPSPPSRGGARRNGAGRRPCRSRSSARLRTETVSIAHRDAVFLLQPRLQHVELQRADHAQDLLRSEQGLEDLHHAFLGQIVQARD